MIKSVRDYLQDDKGEIDQNNEKLLNELKNYIVKNENKYYISDLINQLKSLKRESQTKKLKEDVSLALEMMN